MKYEYISKCKVRQLDGTYKYLKIYAHSKKELEQKKKAKQDKAEQEYQKHLKPKFDVIADMWNEEHEKKIEYNTWSSYQAPLKDLKSEYDNIPIQEITSFDIQTFLNRMKENGYARQTINLRKIVANLIFNYAILNGYLNYNPVTVTRVPAAPKRINNVPNDSDINAIKNNIDIPIGLLAYVIMYTGCRRNEALALKYEDFDFENDIIHIYKSVVYINNKAELKTTKTVNGIRSIPFLLPLKNVIPQNKHGFIFSNDNKIWSKSYVNKEWLKYKRDVGIDTTFLQLRHVFATFCLEAGLEEKDTQLIMGHSKIETTRNIYTHIRESRRKVSADKLNDYFKIS